MCAQVGRLAMALVLATQSISPQERPPTHDPALESLERDARAVPGEFAADVLLRLAGLPDIKDAAWKLDLLEQAYLVAYTANDQYRRAALDTPPDTRQGSYTIASDTALTRLSLQLRAVQQMAALDPVRARELFEWTDLDLVP